MQYLIMKSGVPIFDVARAYGLAALLSLSDKNGVDSPVINETGYGFVIEFQQGQPDQNYLVCNPAWQSLFSASPRNSYYDQAWEGLFITYKRQDRTKKILEVKFHIEQRFQLICTESNKPGLSVKFSGETLPGGLEPSAFKGSKSTTRAQYTESQTDVDKDNWALGCLGGAISGRYIWQNRNIFVIYPIPGKIHFFNWREIREKTFGESLNYLGVKNAVAHYSVILAETLRQMSANLSNFADSFSGLLYFSLFKTGNQWKPSSAGSTNLQSLIDLIKNNPSESAKIFEVWKYLFRRGSVKGSEDLMDAITDLVIDPSLESLENHAKVFLRYIAKKGVKTMHLYTEESLKEVLKNVY